MSDIKLGAQLYTLRDYIQNYEDAENLLEKIKNIKNENIFENNNIVGQIIDEKSGNRIKVDDLKIYELIPMQIKTQ